jgi:5'-nucleotidase
MEAVTLGIPGIALSFASRNDDLVKDYQGIVDSLVRQITEVESFPRDMVLNINLPGCPPNEVKGVKVTRLGSRYFTESIQRMKDPWGREVLWIGGGSITWTGRSDADHEAVKQGYVSITPLHMDLTNYPLLDTVRGWQLGT